MTLSRVGFNSDRTRALVYVGNQSHWLTGAGFYLVLVKTKGGWSVEHEFMSWIS